MFLQNHVKCYYHSVSVSLLSKLESFLFSWNRLEQFNDVLFQENGLNVDFASPIFGLTALQLVEKNGSTPLEAALVSQTPNVD